MGTGRATAPLRSICSVFAPALTIAVSLVAGWACAILSTIVAAVVTYLFGFDKDSEAFVEE